MGAKLTTALLRRAHNNANRCRKDAALLTEAFRGRYGVTHSDIDADDLIEALDYGAGSPPTLADVDAVMTEAGYPRLKVTPDA